MSRPIFELVDNLPTGNMTVRALQALDMIVPGQWENLVGFEATIKAITGETDQEMIQKIGERAIHLYNDTSQGYQRAMWLYQKVDDADKLTATAALGHKIGEKIPFLSFLSRITPKADTAQTVDLGMKLVVEVVAFCQINGIPGDSVGDFVRALAEYSGESLMRMTALICFDGLIPLGPDFLRTTHSLLERLSPADLEKNRIYKDVESLLPGDSPSGKLGFVTQSFDATREWMSSFIADRGISLDRVVGSLKHYVDIADDKLDYLGGFLDLTTNYYEHTGTQTLARSLIQRAVNEL
ncbi:MAG: hypothetical protein HC884_16745 [Chloroflexaceae bacterium]|nr:hypothetical protein [Chloroflexaceae bacterium]